ncbi:MAG: efflux transporter periplasmic adaptor subunit [Rhizobacter sp.]|nr:efflux transporter periplasmic adaptor subunit [Rhizobacter sp.]
MALQSRSRPLWLSLSAALVLAAGAMYYFHLRTAPSAAVAEAAAPLVTLATAKAQSLPLKLDAQGHLVALAQVDVRPQATGTIRSIHFKEGDEVKAGQPMFTIDATDVVAQLARSQASAAQVKAQLDDAQRNLARVQQLARSKFYSQSAVDTSTSNAESLQAQYRAALADIDNTRVLVDRTRVLAPMSGRTGALSVHPGSLAQPSATAALVNIAQLDPIGVEFDLPEGQLAAVLSARAAHSVQVTLKGLAGKTTAGALTFINNTVDVATGTIHLKAQFPNPDRTLWPGSFAQVQVIAGSTANAVTLPPQSLIDGPAGKFVFAVDDQLKVNPKSVTLLRIQDGLAVVGGLAGGERVVAEGQQQLRPGLTVRDANLADPSTGGASSRADTLASVVKSAP